MISKKLKIRIVFGCGKISTINCTSRKQCDSEFKRLSGDSEIYDGHKYTSDFTFERIK